MRAGNKVNHIPNISYGASGMFYSISFLHSHGFLLAEAAGLLLLTVFPSDWLGQGHQHSGVSTVISPNSALGKGRRPHPQGREDHSKQPQCPAPLASPWAC